MRLWPLLLDICVPLTMSVHPLNMHFPACRLIPLDKCPGVHPIGIEDVPRCILSKAVLFAIGDDIVSAADLCWP